MPEKYMAPPWIKYPGFPEGSIWWKTGTGKEYADSFNRWYEALSPKERQEFEEKFPRPVMWDKTRCEPFEQGELFILKWKCIQGFSADMLISERNSGIKRRIIPFWGHKPKGSGVGKECFSQWYRSDFYEDREKYCCMEQYMMAAKARLFSDRKALSEIMETTDPAKIKSLGRNVKNFNEKIWNEVKYHIVLTGNYYKFSANEELRQVLFSTGDGIPVEASPYDNIWGIGMGADNENVYRPDKWQGTNLLGFAIAEVREELKRVRQCENELAE